MSKRTSEFMRSVHLRTIQLDLQQGRSMAEAEQHLRAVGLADEEVIDLLSLAGYPGESRQDHARSDRA
jgi:hypothetical protein